MHKGKKSHLIIPEIQPYFPQLFHAGALTRHVEMGKEILEHLLTEEFINLPEKSASKWFSANLPIIKWNTPSDTPDLLTIYFLCSPTQEVKAEKVLLEVLHKWLIPEKEIHISGFHNMYFYMPGHNSRLFFLAEVQVLVENGSDLIVIQEHLPLLKHELNLSLSSSKYFEYLLGTKGLSFDQKSSQIQGYLRQLVQRAPGQFDLNIFRSMSTFFALSNPDFHKFRLPKHVTRIIVSQYLLGKRLSHLLSISPQRRQLEFRFIRSKLHFPFGTKHVLGLSIAVALSDRYETFTETHAIDAVQKFVPNAQMIKGSAYFCRANYDPIKYLYLEIEKKDGAHFQQKEIQLFQRELKDELKKHIERLIPSVFMIRNEEEVMRNIFLLSQELKYLSDLPQVMVNFEKHESEELYFTVLVVRVLKKHDLSLEEAFEKKKQSYRFISDRVQNVGYVRKKNPKEANVFHLCIPKERSILRTDSSVNFYLARQKVISIITDVIGEVRDYNGGMILKQGELFTQFKHAFSGTAQKDQELLENFFFALNPIEAQAIASLSSLKTLFKLFLEATQKELPRRESYFQKIVKKQNSVFAVLRTKDRSLETILDEELNQLENFSKSLIKTQFNYQGTLLQGFIYETTTIAQQKQFQGCLEKATSQWISKLLNQQVLRLSFLDLPPALDPRLGGDELSSTLLKMLFEGLTRISRDSKPSLALAKSIDISADQKQYLFKLRPSNWSNGTPLIAYDFEYAWKKILSPSFYTPFAYFFYPIKNAKEAKEGRANINDVGVKALDNSTLLVELNNPTPEFLELTSHALYSPINHKLEELHPNWAQTEDVYVCNGPMKLMKIHPNGGYEFVKNSSFWDQAKFKLDRIVISKNNSETALEMFKNDEIDWLGFPMRPWESYFEKNVKGYYWMKFLGTHWAIFNTQRFPFDHLKMRQAFTYAIDRVFLASLIEGSKPAISPLSLIHTSFYDENQARGDKKLALRLFEESLNEIGLTRKNFPVLTLCYPASLNRRKIAQALVKQWEEVFGIPCRLEEYEFHILFSKIVKGDYQMSTLSWKSWINDPLYTLSAFQYRTNKVNFSKWENPKFQELVDQAQKEVVSEKRVHLYQKAEEILIHECPVIPIHYEVYRYACNEHLKDAFCSDSGNIDFRWASIVPD